MKILALQLKRIGDLILTTPALAALRKALPDARLTLVVAEKCGDLLPAIEGVDRGFIFRRGQVNGRLWRHLLADGFDVCLDFTGSDRSAFLAGFSRARDRVAFQWVRRSRVRSLAFTRFVDSPVRERHTTDHYLELVTGWLQPALLPIAGPPRLALPESAREMATKLLGKSPFAVIHPGTARPEKFWLPDRWAQVIAHIREAYGLECVITGGADDFERAHISQIQAALAKPALDLAGKINLLTFAAVIERAAICVSCDTAAVHLAAAFERPQIALFGPTNPFHWRPLHARALVLSAAQPDAPLTDFDPHMRGAPMERISTTAVCGAVDANGSLGSER